MDDMLGVAVLVRERSKRGQDRERSLLEKTLSSDSAVALRRKREAAW